MRATLLAVALLQATLAPLLGPPSAAVALQSPAVTAQLGIAAERPMQDLPLGTSRRVLEDRLPPLVRAAEEPGPRIDSVSVGRDSDAGR